MQPGAFFGEPGQFELLATTVLPELGRRRGRRIRLWSAGCGTGEEAWSIAMVVAEARLPPEREVEIIATDGDPGALARAAEAVYSDPEMQGVDARRRRRHFIRGVGPRQGLWRVIAPLRDRVELYELDLEGPWPAGAPFDAVFGAAAIARLDPPDAHRLARRFGEVLAPRGALFLGQAPAWLDDFPDLAPWRSGVFRKRAG